MGILFVWVTRNLQSHLTGMLRSMNMNERMKIYKYILKSYGERNACISFICKIIKHAINLKNTNLEQIFFYFVENNI